MGVENLQDRRAKRSLDSEVNILPFINILAMSICFLLMTAVWYQVTALPVKQSHGTEGGAETGSLELEMKFTGPGAVNLAILKRGRAVHKATLSAPSTEELLPQLDTTLLKWSAALSPKGHPQAKLGQLIGSGMVTPKVGVSYGELVAAMDVLREHELVNLGVVPVPREGR